MRFLILLFILLTSLSTKAHETVACNLAPIQAAMDIVAANITNATQTRTSDGGPYKRQELACGDDVCTILKDSSFLVKYEPQHPDANEFGYVAYPNIDLMHEIGSMVELQREYENEVANCK